MNIVARVMHLEKATVTIKFSEFDILMLGFDGQCEGQPMHVLIRYAADSDSDPQLVKLGMNTYHLGINEQGRESHGGVQKLRIEGARLHFRFDALAAGKLGGDELSIDIGNEEELDKLCFYLRTIFREHARQVDEVIVPAVPARLRYPSIQTQHGVLLDVVEAGTFFAAVDLSQKGSPPVHFMGVLPRVSRSDEQASRPRVINVEWREDWQVACLFLDGVCEGIFDFTSQRAYSRPEAPVGDSRWEDFELTDERVRELYVPRVNRRPRP